MMERLGDADAPQVLASDHNPLQVWATINTDATLRHGFETS
jgi:hypothetical protein